MPYPMIALDDLAVRFGGIAALSGVTFTAGASEFIGIIGPNGAGKTTLFNVISGMVSPSAGAFRIDGIDLIGQRAHVFNRVGIARTFQTARVFRNLSVRENVEFGLRLPERRGGRARHLRTEADDLLDRLGLRPQAGISAGSLPPTRQRLVESGMALATNPRLLLLDEVAAGLTQSEAKTMASLIGELRSEREMCVIWIEHNVEVLMRAVERVLVLHHGEVLADGPPARITKDPAVIDAYLGETAME
jgi:branched-chain amino acid transport system ATP-binding protein